MANMTIKKKAMRKKLSEEEIDRFVVEQADDNSGWGKPIHVSKAKPAMFTLPADLAARAAFLAQLHREPSIGDWLIRIIRERIELEEAAFAEVKRVLSKRRSA
jgi:hypothetical protein